MKKLEDQNKKKNNFFDEYLNENNNVDQILN
jgi:hypothetical protein